MRALQPDLRRFHEVYGAAVVVLDADGTVLAGSGTARGPAVDAAVAAALDGNPSTAPDPVWPWHSDPMVIATPIGRDAQVLGAVVVVQPTGDVRRAVAWRLGLVVALGLAALAVVALLVALPLVGWILRPVRDLERSARRLGEGDTTARVPGAGPPEPAAAWRRRSTRWRRASRSPSASSATSSPTSPTSLANPVTALRLRLEALAEERAGEDLGAAIEETDRIARALEGLIEVSSAGSRDRERTAVDLVAQVRDRIALWEPLFGHLLSVRLEPGTASVVVEPDLAPVVVDALLDNALKYAPGAAVESRPARRRRRLAAALSRPRSRA
ncbi:HAMP domain-containing histidine kinase [Nocardioides sp. W3-2-3]|nr:HAMP domain-containing histidine kinase [Nocardioides convexus]